jgi:hypothetical protein
VYQPFPYPAYVVPTASRDFPGTIVLTLDLIADPLQLVWHGTMVLTYYGGTCIAKYAFDVVTEDALITRHP